MWLTSLPSGTQYLTRGGESMVFMDLDRINVIKVNDGIYYATWTEYFTSLVLHNLLFPNTAYSLVGFAQDDANLCTVLRQPFIKGEQAKLEDIKRLLTFNGFVNTKRQDYFNEEFGLVLEDMHDENVISKQELLFFIDTVFYVDILLWCSPPVLKKSSPPGGAFMGERRQHPQTEFGSFLLGGIEPAIVTHFPLKGKVKMLF
jgi:hypothetical protein